MITEGILKKVLSVLGFQYNSEEKVYAKDYSKVSCQMKVDIAHQRLLFPAAIKGRERNNGFDKPENFVVFECVDRLLGKGYRPEHIELEKEWHLGHDAKSGRADICVSDTKGNMLFIVECKTWGREFDKAFNDTKHDGAQLFSYWQQEQSCKWLVLYASDIKDGIIDYKAPTISCSDDANLLLLAKKDKSIKLYRNAHTAPEKHEVWVQTYSNLLFDDLIFSNDSAAYQIGVKPLLKKNLRDFTPDDKIVNKFEEILRHNNVSDKENAFNRLVALFICKLVDESTKGENDEVEFQYKQGTDTYESLQDRLQRLHRDGMEKFMREEIYYVPADYPERLFSNYTSSKRKKAIEDLQNTIRILKFYSNNDFAFKDVHNEELFYQNGKILVEMVQLFEKYRIVYPSKHQFLGDLFEQLLNKGFKQNEGQFFTPMPITRFIWDSLPVERMIKSERGTVYPKVIDYACGAGHFLTEAIEAINHFIQSDGNNIWVKDHIYGIEKDYRLARVAKISLFMNGAGEGNIIFGDGLENAPDKGINNNLFDILVANPPYSVKDFKQHLKLKNNDFVLLDKIGLNSGEIETLFVERIGQLLKPKGIAAVILPSSILSNDSASYTGAREYFLENFYIRAIVSLGSKTFGATSTNTVIMFLEKYNEPPKQIDLCTDSINAIFSGADLSDWKDKEILNAYISQIGITQEEYKAFLNKSYSISELEDIDYFKMYVSAFSESSDVKNLKKTKTYQKKSTKEQASIFLGKFYDFAQSVEYEKLFYFSLVYPQRTVIITSPADNKEQKDFLGYDWSNRKGNEGIQIITPGGKMYDDSNRAAEGTLSNAIKKSFDGLPHALNAEQKVYCNIVSTKDMLDFSRVSFNKSLQTNVDSVIKNTSKYPALRLSECVNVTSGLWTGEKPPFRKVKVIRNTNFTMDGQMDISDVAEINVEVSAFNDRMLQKGDIILEKSGGSQTQAVGRVVYFDIDGDDYSFSNFTARLRIKNDVILSKYLYYLLNEYYQKGKTFGYQNGMGGLKNLDMGRYMDIPIPIPPIKVQQQIIDESVKIEKKYKATRMSIETYKQKIEDLFVKLDIASRAGGGGETK
jgi:type I restriction-modification system DNA methylase subunit